MTHDEVAQVRRMDPQRRVSLAAAPVLFVLFIAAVILGVDAFLRAAYNSLGIAVACLGVVAVLLREHELRRVAVGRRAFAI